MASKAYFTIVDIHHIENHHMQQEEIILLNIVIDPNPIFLSICKGFVIKP
jgi:hypothetical protein